MMNGHNYIMMFIFIISLLYVCEPSMINTKQSQIESKRKMSKKIAQYAEGIYPKKRRRMDDDEDEEIDPTLLVYDRCDHGHTPDDISDCKKYQTDESSCCIFTYGQDTGCVKIGFKYLGSKSIGDMTVTCHNQFIKSFNFIIVVLAFFIL